MTRPARTGRIHWCIRTGALLSLIGLMRLARAVRAGWWRLLAGTAFTVLGVMLRESMVSLFLLPPGLLFLLSALLAPPISEEERIRRAKLERELAGYFTPAQRRDLQATLDRYPDSVTYELRDILASK